MGSFKKVSGGQGRKIQMNCAIPLIINKTLKMALSLLGMGTALLSSTITIWFVHSSHPTISPVFLSFIQSFPSPI